jgi:hypothetical protein
VQAHQTITAGPYAIEYGWLSEPPVVGQSNAIVINVSQENASGATSQPAQGSATPAVPKQIDISGLKVEVTYGGQSKFLTLQPLGEDTPGQFIAPILPSIPGTYTLRLSGTLGETPVQAEVQPEEVQPAASIQFPQSSSTDANGGGTNWLGLAGVVLGAIGTVLGALALFRRKT